MITNQEIATLQQAAESTPHTAELGIVIGRIEEAIDIETRDIHVSGFDLATANARKTRHLYDLSRAMRGMQPGELSPSQRTSLERLRSKLLSNESAILAHLNAVSEIADIVQSAIEDAEADGTYSTAAFGGNGE